ncbi:hypothetical protein ACIBCO_40995 [Streptomyces violascens]|uniref:hypothetical protein n=1 Tax=Streptomyces violascens TaxID=67381 RepID=UPI00378FE86C
MDHVVLTLPQTRYARAAETPPWQRTSGESPTEELTPEGSALEWKHRHFGSSTFSHMPFAGVLLLHDASQPSLALDAFDTQWETVAHPGPEDYGGVDLTIPRGPVSVEGPAGHFQEGAVTGTEIELKVEEDRTLRQTSPRPKRAASRVLE